MRKNRQRKGIIVVMLMVLLLAMSSAAAYASDWQGTVNSDQVNLRVERTTSSQSLGKLSIGNKVTIHEANGEWYSVTTEQGKKGWIASWLVDPEAKKPATAQGQTKTGVVNDNHVNLREKGTTDSKSLGKLSAGTKVTIHEQQGDWYSISTVQGQKGWIASWLVDLEQQKKQVTVNEDIVNIREKADVNSKGLTQVKKGEKLELLATQGEWHKVKLSNGQIGWVASYLVDAEGTTSAPVESKPSTEQDTTSLGNGCELTIAKDGQGMKIQVGGVPKDKYKVKQDGTVLSIEVDLLNVKPQIHPEEFEGIVTVAFSGELINISFANNFTYTVNHQEDNLSIQVVGAKNEANDQPEENVIPEIERDTGLAGKTVVLDPGHGQIKGTNSTDPGAIGLTLELMERDLVLDIALMVQSMLEDDGAEVLMTRDKEGTPLDLKGRANFANEANGDIFVSLHLNSNINRSVDGTEVHYYAPESIAHLYQQKEQRVYLADCIQKQLLEHGGRKDRGLKESNFVVIRETKMPSVLVEMAFLSNEAVEKLLATEEFKRSLATGIYEGITQYFNQYGSTNFQ